MIAVAWFGSLAGIAGALLVALNDPALSRWGWWLWLASSAALVTVAAIRRDRPHLALFAVYSAINVLGLWRWWLA